jgi:hypothetical protein
VVGGSACSTAGLQASELAWPEIAFGDKGQYQLQKISIGGLTFVRSVEILFSMEYTNLLILHFGTSIGWPSLVVRLQDRFGIKFSSEFGFHQPISEGKSAGVIFKARKWVKLKIKNIAKYFFLLIGLYKPKVSIHEIRDQISAVISLASAKSDQILWIQHRALQDSHTFAERLFYKRYYSRIISYVKSANDPKIEILELPDDFMVRKNYLNDWVHLSAKGHQELAKRVLQKLNKSTL